MTTKITQESLDYLQEIVGERVSIANLIRCIRQCEELSQVDMAEKLGISRQRLCDIENGRSRVSPKLAVKFAKKLDHSVEQFVRFALQDILDRDHVDFIVDVSKAA